MTVIAQNRKARHLYRILESFEAGISLLGSEIKACRAHNVSFKDSYAALKGEELFLYNLHISTYKSASYQNHDPVRVRKLLLHKKEIKRLIGKTVQKGLTLVPLKLYLKGRWLKIEIALAMGKQNFDKRDDIKKREHKIEMDRAFRKKG